MGALALKHESVRAVGNMKSNARGDIIDSGGNVVSSRSQQTNKNYNQGVATNVSAGPVPTSSNPKKHSAPSAPAPVDAAAVATTQSGLAGALARAKNNKE